MFRTEHHSTVFIHTEQHPDARVKNALSILENPRIAHHLMLSELSDAVPGIVYPDTELLIEARNRNGLLMEKVDGVPLSQAHECFHLSPQDYINIGYEVLSQIQFLLRIYGVLLEDRTLNNIYLVESDRSGLVIEGRSYEVKQIDLREMYDVQFQSVGLNHLKDILERVGTVELPNDELFISRYHEMLTSFRSELMDCIHRLSYKDAYTKSALHAYNKKQREESNENGFPFHWYTIENVAQELLELEDALKGAL